MAEKAALFILSMRYEVIALIARFMVWLAGIAVDLAADAGEIHDELYDKIEARSLKGE